MFSSRLAPSRLVHHCRRFFSKEASDKEAREKMHAKLQQFREPESTPQTVWRQIQDNPERKRRYNAALWNMAASFLLVLTAAQSWRASVYQRRAEEAKTED